MFAFQITKLFCVWNKGAQQIAVPPWQWVVGGCHSPLDCNPENILIAALANRKTRQCEIARSFDFKTSLKSEFGEG